MTEAALTLSKADEFDGNLLTLISQTVDLRAVSGNKWRGYCPFHKHKDPSFYVEPDTGRYYCRACRARGDVFDWIRYVNSVGDQPVYEPVNQKVVLTPVHLKQLRDAVTSAVPDYANDGPLLLAVSEALKIWSRTVNIADTPGEVYLHSLGLRYEHGFPGVVRFHPGLLHGPTGRIFPALVMPVRNLTGDFVGVQVIYLDQDGQRRAPVEYNRRMTEGAFRSFVKFSNGNPSHVIITSNEELALMLLMACPEETIWSAMTPANMRSMVPHSMRKVTLCVDYSGPDEPNVRKLVNDAKSFHMERGHDVAIMKIPFGMRFKDYWPAE